MTSARAAAAALLIAGGLPAVARAQAIAHEDEQTYSSPQRWALEVRLGPYLPDVDAEFSGDPAQRPHRKYFGKKARLLAQAELDWQFFRAFGTAAVGVQVGYFRETARAFVETRAGGTQGERADDDTSLWLLPVAVQLVYRMDVAAQRLKIPLVPYGKLGIGYTMWTITDGNGKVSRSGAPGDRGRGGTPGWQAAAGVSFLLDVLDPGAARALDGEVGVNHTYLFVEGAHFATSGLGRKNALRVGDTTWMAGLMFEF